MTRWEAISILSEVEQEYRHHPGPPPEGKTAWLSIPVENAMKILTRALESRIPRRGE
jgi:hypothetical protein